MPSGYTSNYVFEFTKGVVTMRALCTTPDSLSERFDLLRSGADYNQTKKAIIRDLFGVERVIDASMLML